VSGRRALLGVLAATAALVAPAGASAHAGATTPVATSFVAQIDSVPAGIRARVVDGDQQLWLRAPARETVVVLGLYGEPYLRFGADGVSINEASPTAYLNRGTVAQVPSSAGARKPARWRRVSAGHSFRWHEDRLHALALTARHPTTALVGSWTIPLRVDGTPARVAGQLVYRRPPTLLWLWPIAVTAACALALLRLRRPALDRVLAATFTAGGVVAVVAAHAARDLYGRPTLEVEPLVWLAVASAFAIGVALLWTRRRWRPFALLASTGYALTSGLTLLPTLRKGHVLAAVPAPVDRLTATLALSAAAGGLLTLAVGRLDRRAWPAIAMARRGPAERHP
jgi:hypothetical protein